jgi:S-adenosyl-L-methionine hydrolase (adenosine-forming)
MSIITLTTDFGIGSSYAAAMKGVILSINPAVTIVDISHEIPAQDIQAAAIVLDDVCERFPPETIHLAVVDPGVGTDRAIVYARINSRNYIAPDNGLLCRLASRTEPELLVRLENPAYWLSSVSATFHGRDIMAPAAAHLSLGVDPRLLGRKEDELSSLAWPQVSLSPSRIKGNVMEIDSFGNLITNITADVLAGRPTDERVCIICNIYETWGIYHAYAEKPRGAFVALIGSSNKLELAVVGGNAAQQLGINRGAPVVMAWE